jgi:hypothetical protein
LTFYAFFLHQSLDLCTLNRKQVQIRVQIDNVGSSELATSHDETNLGQSVDHDFIEKILPSGRIAVTLEIPPYLFKRRKVSKKDGGKVSFSCNSCDVYAYATQHFAEKINQS